MSSVQVDQYPLVELIATIHTILNMPLNDRARIGVEQILEWLKDYPLLVAGTSDIQKRIESSSAAKQELEDVVSLIQ